MIKIAPYVETLRIVLGFAAIAALLFLAIPNA